MLRDSSLSKYVSFSLSFIQKMIMLVLAIFLLVILFVVIYSEFDLPQGIDKRSFMNDEGTAFNTLDVSLIKPDKEQKEGRRVIALNSGWGYITRTNFYDIDSTIDVIPVSQNFKSDFASVPSPFNRIINPFGRHAEAAVIHDWLYVLGGAKNMTEKDRKYADIVFYDAMRRLEVNWLRRRIMYVAVRIGGKQPFKKTNVWNNSFYEPITDKNIKSECIIDPPESIFANKDIKYAILAFNEENSTNKGAAEKNRAIWRLYKKSFSEDGRNYFNDDWNKAHRKRGCKKLLLDGLTKKFDVEAGLNESQLKQEVPKLWEKMFFKTTGEERLSNYINKIGASSQMMKELLKEEKVNSKGKQQ